MWAELRWRMWEVLKWCAIVGGLVLGFVLLMAWDLATAYVWQLGEGWPLLALVMLAVPLWVMLGLVVGDLLGGAALPAFFMEKVNVVFVIGLLAAFPALQLDLRGRTETAVVTQVWTDDLPEGPQRACAFAAASDGRDFGTARGGTCKDLTVGQQVVITVDPEGKLSPMVGEAGGLFVRRPLILVFFGLVLLLYVAFSVILVMVYQEDY